MMGYRRVKGLWRKIEQDRVPRYHDMQRRHHVVTRWDYESVVLKSVFPWRSLSMGRGGWELYHCQASPLFSSLGPTMHIIGPLVK